ncbi:sensor histidine kinase [Flavobacterium sp. MDT1-60]|uniref:sensor histidine kinase n=1 Tax=Flavobacterium sp. MDT1-60 TaxID=1979344 RepID=UPI00177DAEED|nr:histidine kinase [Flavobacterium sp. MDT1-60]QOG04542.1 histidine kinase [Flavobacterium sp. MDT1-60]
MNNIAKSFSPFILKEIYKMNVFLTLLISLIALFFLILFKNSASLILFMTLKSLFYIFTVTFSLSAILEFCSLKFPNDIVQFRIWRYVASFCTSIILQMLLWPFFAYMAHVEWSPYDIELIMTFLMEAVFISTLVLLLQDFAILRLAKTQTELENSRLQLRTAEAENLLLKQQIHPHFLFNSLNTLKALYKKDLLLGEHYLIQLAGFLRTAVTLNAAMATTLEQEIDFCQNYLEMQKMRFSEALEWDIKINNPDMLKCSIPTFSLQPLAENAIKHNRFTKQQPLHIKIEQKGAYILVSNTMNLKKHSETSLKSGLANLAERCLIWSGNEIIIQNDGVTFTVSFKINTDENHNY